MSASAAGMNVPIEEERKAGFVEGGELDGREREVERGELVVELGRGVRADDGGRDAGLGQLPGERDGGGGSPACFGD